MHKGSRIGAFGDSLDPGHPLLLHLLLLTQVYGNSYPKGTKPFSPVWGVLQNSSRNCSVAIIAEGKHFPTWLVFIDAQLKDIVTNNLLVVMLWDLQEIFIHGKATMVLGGLWPNQFGVNLDVMICGRCDYRILLFIIYLKGMCFYSLWDFD